MKCTYLLIISIFIYNLCFGKISPNNGTSLNQIQILFEIDEVNFADSYNIEFFVLNKLDSNKIFLLKKINLHSLSQLVQNIFQFGNSYQWRYSGIRNKQSIFQSKMFSFKINTCKRIDSTLYRTKIISNEKNKQINEILFLDYTGMAINKKGNPIWFLPFNEDSTSTLVNRDLQLTPIGTISHLNINGAYEKNLLGETIWEAPNDGLISGNKKENYHHDFKVLCNGSYMVCGFKQIEINDKRYNTIIQYNSKKEIIWYWDEIASLKNDTFFKNKNNTEIASHLNGFTLTKDTTQIYLSFKNLSSIFLLNKITGRFIRKLYGNTADAAFLQQHGPWLTRSNDILIYNNNIVDKEIEEIRYPEALIFSYSTPLNRYKLVWKYKIISDSFPKGIAGKEGYCFETKNKNVFICTGGSNYALEVNKLKQKIWECFFYKRNIEDSNWVPYSNYRCHMSSSLYPRYFTVQSKFSIQKNQIKINNDGTNEDEYEVILKSKINKILKTVKLKPGKSVIITLKQNEKSLLIKPKGIERISKEVNL